MSNRFYRRWIKIFEFKSTKNNSYLDQIARHVRKSGASVVDLFKPDMNCHAHLCFYGSSEQAKSFDQWLTDGGHEFTNRQKAGHFGLPKFKNPIEWVDVPADLPKGHRLSIDLSDDKRYAHYHYLSDDNTVGVLYDLQTDEFINWGEPRAGHRRQSGWSCGRKEDDFHVTVCTDDKRETIDFSGKRLPWKKIPERVKENLADDYDQYLVAYRQFYWCNVSQHRVLHALKYDREENERGNLIHFCCGKFQSRQGVRVASHYEMSQRPPKCKTCEKLRLELARKKFRG